MQLDNLESCISKLYQINLNQLVRLSELRKKAGGLNFDHVAEYNVRVRDDDKYRKIRVELDLIKEGGSTDYLCFLLSERLDELSEESVEKIRFRGSRKKIDRPRKEDKGELWNKSISERKDQEFLESMNIKGDTSWIN